MRLLLKYFEVKKLKLEEIDIFFEIKFYYKKTIHTPPITLNIITKGAL